MSNRYKGGIISATPPTTTNLSASGAWTLEQQMQAQGAGNWPYGGPYTYVEDVFSTYLYTGNGSTQTITNGIDLSTKGGLVWTKGRSTITDNMWFDTARGVQKELSSNKTNAQATNTLGITAFGTTGYSMGSDGSLNGSGTTYGSWTFRKQPKFFDVVTYTGNGVAGRTVPHNLGSTPGFIIVKSSSAVWDWGCYHRSLGATKYLDLNTTDAAGTLSTVWNNTEPTATEFTVGTQGRVNQNGQTYVAYLFAHDAGGFGLTGTDNVISCGIVNGASNPSVNLGYEPQFVMFKAANTTGNWLVYDNMRGWTANNGSGVGNVRQLIPNSSGAETATTSFYTTSTGFGLVGSTVGFDYIYIAIRRGPMKVPTSGTSVFAPLALANSVNTQNVTGFPIDLQIRKARSVAYGNPVYDRLRGMSSVPSSTSIVMGPQLFSNATSAEATSDDAGYLYDNTSFRTGQNWTGSTAYWNFGRAPSFFDEVCYTGTGTTTGITHNLNAVPEMYIIKRRDFPDGQGWMVYHKDAVASGAANAQSSYLTLNLSDAVASNTNRFGNVAPTTTTFGVSSSSANESGAKYVAYLFATCPGVSKVGSYTGNGSSQTINCGFTAGARFVLIKRINGTGDWYVWDTARGIIAGNDPHLSLNTTVAEVTTNDTIDPDNTGFIVNQVAATGVNVNTATYIFLAIA